MFLYQQSTDQWMFNNRRIGREIKISLLPRRCHLSGKSLWFRKAIIITSMITGPGDQLFETYWCDRDEFLLHELKRKV